MQINTPAIYLYTAVVLALKHSIYLNVQKEFSLSQKSEKCYNQYQS